MRRGRLVAPGVAGSHLPLRNVLKFSSSCLQFAFPFVGFGSKMAGCRYIFWIWRVTVTGGAEENFLAVLPDLCIMPGKRARRGYYVTTYASSDWWFLRRGLCVIGTAYWVLWSLGKPILFLHPVYFCFVILKWLIIGLISLTSTPPPPSLPPC